MSKTFAPEEARAIREAYLLAKSRFTQSLTDEQSTLLAKSIVELAGEGTLRVEALATRAVARLYMMPVHGLRHMAQAAPPAR